MLKAWIAAAAVAAAAWSGTAIAQSAATVSTLEDAAWLAGRWIGEGLGGTVEETWAPPMGGQMVGHFRLMRDGAPVFYEIMLMEVVDGGVQMRVKHFNPDFVSWEEKDGWHAFAPAGADAESLRFHGLTLRRLDDQTAEFIVTLRYPDGVRHETLRMRRAPL